MDTAVAEKRTWRSRFVIFPLKGDEEKRGMSNRIVKIISQSSLCESNPFLKKIFIQHVRMWCIVVETSGTQSIKVICASLPYLLKIMSRTNPKVKMLLEDERLVSCLSYLQECDMESILMSMCETTLVLQRGVKKYYPTFCISLARDSFLFGEAAIESFIQFILQTSMKALHFIYEDLPPMIQSLCAQNCAITKDFIQNLPLYFVTVIKCFVAVTLQVKRSIVILLKCSKRLMTSFQRVLVNSSLHSDLVVVYEKLRSCFKYLKTYLSSEVMHRAYKYARYHGLDICLPYAKDFLLTFSKNCWAVISNAIPVIFKAIRIIISEYVPLLYDFAKDHAADIAKFYYFIRYVFKAIYSHVKRISFSLYYPILNSRKVLKDSTRMILPHLLRLSSYILFFSVKFTKLLCKRCIILRKDIAVIMFRLYETSPTFRQAFSKISKLLKSAWKLFYRLHQFVYPCLVSGWKTFAELLVQIFPVLCSVFHEINLTLLGAFAEVFSKTLMGLKRESPSLWYALHAVTPPTIHATYEIARSSKNSVIVVYPVLFQASLVLHPEVSKAFVILINDGSKACVEIASKSYTASRELALVAKTVSNQIPVVRKALMEVLTTTSCAMVEVFDTSVSAGSRVMSDFKKGLCIANKSFLVAESELLTEFNIVVYEVNYIVDSREAREMITLMKDLNNAIVSVTSSQRLALYHTFSYSIHVMVTYGSSSISRVHSSLMGKNTLLLRRVNRSFFISVLFGIPTYAVERFSEFHIRSRICKMLTVLWMFSAERSANSVSLISPHFREMCVSVKQNIYIYTPKLWSSFKTTVSVMWTNFCNVTPGFWTCVEKASSETWYFTNRHIPEAWLLFQTFVEKAWTLTCDVTPSVWNWASPKIPVLWVASRETVQSMWKLYIETCCSAWNMTTTSSAEIWVCSCYTFPKIWMAICSNSRRNWDLIRCIMEFSWDKITETSSCSWQLMQKTLSLSWQFGVCPVARSACHKTVLVLSKSIRYSCFVCVKTRSVVWLLSDDENETYFPAPSIGCENTKCAAVPEDKLNELCSSNSAPFPSLSEGGLLSNAVYLISAVSSQLSSVPLNYYNIAEFMKSVMTVPKTSFTSLGLTGNLNINNVGELMKGVMALKKSRFTPLGRAGSFRRRFLKKLSSVSVTKNVNFATGELFVLH